MTSVLLNRCKLFFIICFSAGDCVCIIMHIVGLYLDVQSVRNCYTLCVRIDLHIWIYWQIIHMFNLVLSVILSSYMLTLKYLIYEFEIVTFLGLKWKQFKLYSSWKIKVYTWWLRSLNPNWIVLQIFNNKIYETLWFW